MRSLAKPVCLIGILAAAAVIASAADARSVNTKRFAGAYASASAQSSTQPGSAPYRAEGNPFPRRHGGTTASPDFQLMR